MRFGRKSLRHVTESDHAGPPLVVYGSITAGSEDVAIRRHRPVNTQERELLAVLANGELSIRRRVVPFETLADAGLVVFTPVGEGRWTATITEDGRAALRRGWYEES